MKKIMQYSAFILLSECISFTSCKKESHDLLTPPPVSPAKATINFHIKNSIVFPGYDVYLYRIISYPNLNIYDSTKNIYLRQNIDTTFIYSVEGNSNNVFVVGIPDFDAIPIYIENRYIVSGSNFNWEITY